MKKLKKECQKVMGWIDNRQVMAEERMPGLRQKSKTSFKVYFLVTITVSVDK